MVYVAAIWLTLFGVWPIAHPSHSTFANAFTWIDWCLHIMGFVVLTVGMRIRNEGK